MNYYILCCCYTANQLAGSMAEFVEKESKNSALSYSERSDWSTVGFTLSISGICISVSDFSQVLRLNFFLAKNGWIYSLQSEPYTKRE
ncbi:MAG: hypothetical protein WCH65_04870 [bacterium]